MAIKLIMVCVLAFVLHEEHLQYQHRDDHERKQHYSKHYVSGYNIIFSFLKKLITCSFLMNLSVL
jgi:hypothetical protein